MSDNNQSNKGFKSRFVYLINPKFQLTMIGYSVALAFSIILIIYLFQGYYYNHMANVGVELGLEQGHPFYQIIAEQKEVMDKFYLFMSLAIFVLVFTIVTYVSHQIAGPMYRLKMYFDKREMDLRKLSFRKKDFFQELPDSINDYFESKK